MKTNKVVAMVLVTVAALSSVACSDAPTEEVGVTGSAIENGHKCSEKELELRRKENVETTAGCFIFRCYDASKAGASNADPRWGNTGTRCPEPAPPPVEDAHDRRDERFACEKGAKQCTNKILMICADDRLSYVTAPDQSSEEARLCHQTPTSTPPASSTPPPAASIRRP